MIIIKKSKTADSRTCDFSKISKETLIESSKQHIEDVEKGLCFFMGKMIAAAVKHDKDKLTGIDQFYADFITGFKTTDWWDNHRKVSRHHLSQGDGVPKDVNLVDVIEMIIDCVMAGMGRTGEVYPLEIDPDLLMIAFNNTVELLKKEIVVKE